MTVLGHTRWLVMVVLCAAAVSGCGSESTGRESPQAVTKAVAEFAGEDARVSQVRVRVKDGDDDSFRWLAMVVACKPDGGCAVVAPDGARYPDLRTFVDDSGLLETGDTVTGSATLTSPGEPARTETFTRRAVQPWLLYAGGGALLVLAAGLVTWLHRRRRARRKPPRTWDVSRGDGGRTDGATGRGTA